MPYDGSTNEKRMSLWAHIEELRKCVPGIFGVVGGIAVFCMLFDLGTSDVGGYELP